HRRLDSDLSQALGRQARSLRRRAGATARREATRGEEMTLGELGADAISFERVYDASVEDVWALWTTREGLEAWFAPEGMHFEVSALELRVGGAFDHVMTAVGAEQLAYLANLGRPATARVSGRFVDIVRY